MDDTLMDEEFSKMVALRVIKFAQGRISIKGRTVIFLPVEVLLLSFKNLEEAYGTDFASKHLYDLGSFQTRTGSPKYYSDRKNLGMTLGAKDSKGDPAFEMGRKVLAFAGYGDIEWAEILNQGQRGVVKIKNSPFAEEYVNMYGKSQMPVCHYLAGLLRGIFEARFNTAYVVHETLCKATGKGDQCVFEFNKG